MRSLSLFAILFFFMLQFSKPHLENKDAYSRKIHPPKDIEKFTFGYNDSFADSLWLRVLQDFDYCERKPKNPQGETEKTAAVAAEFSQQKVAAFAKCEKGWVFQLIQSITNLSPNFVDAYKVGGVALSVITDDRDGAAIILSKGVARFPKDWVLSYTAGYHYLIETNNFVKAAEYLKNAADNGAPGWVYSLVGKVYTKSGQAIVAKITLENYLSNNPETKYTARIKQRLVEVNRVLGLTKKKGTLDNWQQQLAKPKSSEVLIKEISDLQNIMGGRGDAVLFPVEKNQ